MTSPMIEIRVGKGRHDSLVLMNGKQAPVKSVRVEFSTEHLPFVQMELIKTSDVEIGVIRGYIVNPEEYLRFEAWRAGHVEQR